MPRVPSDDQHQRAGEERRHLHQRRRGAAAATTARVSRVELPRPGRGVSDAVRLPDAAIGQRAPERSVRSRYASRQMSQNAAGVAGRPCRSTLSRRPEAPGASRPDRRVPGAASAAGADRRDHRDSSGRPSTPLTSGGRIRGDGARLGQAREHGVARQRQAGAGRPEVAAARRVSCSDEDQRATRRGPPRTRRARGDRRGGRQSWRSVAKHVGEPFADAERLQPSVARALRRRRREMRGQGDRGGRASHGARDRRARRRPPSLELMMRAHQARAAAPSCVAQRLVGREPIERELQRMILVEDVDADGDRRRAASARCRAAPSRADRASARRQVRQIGDERRPSRGETAQPRRRRLAVGRPAQAGADVGGAADNRAGPRRARSR